MSLLTPYVPWSHFALISSAYDFLSMFSLYAQERPVEIAHSLAFYFAFIIAPHLLPLLSLKEALFDGRISSGGGGGGGRGRG